VHTGVSARVRARTSTTLYHSLQRSDVSLSASTGGLSYMTHAMSLTATQRARGGDAAGNPMAMVGESVQSAVSRPMVDSIQLASQDNLMHGVNRTLSRETARRLTLALHNSLTSKISRLVSFGLHRSLPHLITHYVTRPAVPMLSHTIAMVVSHAMSRRSEDDYFCHFCLKSPAHIFCKYCEGSMHVHTNLEHYVQYFTAYYSKYYDSFYGEAYTDKVSNDYLREFPYNPGLD